MSFLHYNALIILADAILRTIEHTHYNKLATHAKKSYNGLPTCHRLQTENSVANAFNYKISL